MEIKIAIVLTGNYQTKKYSTVRICPGSGQNVELVAGIDQVLGESNEELFYWALINIAVLDKKRNKCSHLILSEAI